MGTEKRYIPINHTPGSAERAGAGAGPTSPGDGSAGGQTPPVYAPAATFAAAGGKGHAPGPEAEPQAGHGQASGRGHGAGQVPASVPGAGATRAAHGPSTADVQALTEERDGLVAEREALAKEKEALSDALLRLRAEFDNFRRRTAKEVLDAGARAEGDLLVDLLPVYDNLDRALDAAEHHEEGKVLDGVRLTRNMFTGLLAKAGVEAIEGTGESFDPNLHEAVMVQASDQAEGTVATVLQKGYRQGDRVLRPARVAVSAGPTEPAIAG